jgi:SAM-dependent methyltransferase
MARAPREIAGRAARRLAARQIAVNNELRGSVADVRDRLEIAAGATSEQLERHDARLAAIDARFEASDRLRAEVIQALEAVRARVDPLVAAAGARPFMAGDPFGPFEEPGAGTVYGYRDAAVAPDAAEYRSFEEVFRGSEDRVRDRQRGYLAVVGERAPILDAGCGRGEFLDLLAEAGIAASGVDADAGMVQRCLDKGHDVREGDLNDHLEGLADGSLGAIFSAQVIEHLPYDALRRFLAVGRRKLAPGGRLIAETVNPHAPDALKAFWVDPTHQHPVFPEVALALAQIAGFPSAFVFHPTGSGDAERDRLIESAYALVATTAS